MANNIIWNDNTRIKWKKINGIYLTEYDGTLEEACRENEVLDRNDIVSFFSTIGLQEVDYRDGYPITARYNEQYGVGYFSWEPHYIYESYSYSYTSKDNQPDVTFDAQQQRLILTFNHIPNYFSNYKNTVTPTSMIVDVVIDEDSVSRFYASDILKIEYKNQDGQYDINNILGIDQYAQLIVTIHTSQMRHYHSVIFDHLYLQIDYASKADEILRFSNSPDRFIRFRLQESNKNGEYISESNSLANNMTGIFYLGDIIFGINQGELYNWDNYDWNLKKNILFNTLPGDENSQTKISEVEFPKTENWNENTQTLIRRQSQQQLIPKLLIDSKYLMNIRIPKTNKQEKEEDGYIIEKLKINNIENNYRLGAFPDVYPIHIKRFGGWHQSMISIADIDNYNPETDLLVLYQQEYKDHTVTNPYYVGVVEETDWHKDTDTTYGLKIIVPYGGGSPRGARICGFQNMTSPQVTINTKVNFYDVTENIYFYHDKCYNSGLHLDAHEITLNPLNESYTSVVDSILTTETASSQINLCNVGDYAKNSSIDHFDIGEGYRIEDQKNVKRLLPEHGAKIQLNINHSVFKEDLVFSNDACPSDNLLANDVTCYSKILDESGANYSTSDYNGYINGHLSIDGCISDTPIHCVGEKLENKDLLEYKYTNSYCTVDVEAIDNNNFKYQIKVKTTNDVYDTYTTVQYFRFGVNLKRYNKTIDDRLNNADRNASKYKYDLVLWKNIKQ